MLLRDLTDLYGMLARTYQGRQVRVGDRDWPIEAPVDVAAAFGDVEIEYEERTGRRLGNDPVEHMAAWFGSVEELEVT